MTRITMMGAGFIGQMHANAFHSAGVSRDRPVRPEFQLLLETERNAELAEEIGQRYGFVDVRLGDWQGAFDPQAGGLFINAAPNDLHHGPTVEAARHGYHIFSEKPLAGSADEAYRIWQDVENCGVKHQCAFVQRFVPAMRKARDMVRNGDIGEILHFRANFLLDMRAAPDGELTWRFLKSRAGGGAIGDLASHHIDLCRYTTGMELQSVTATTRTWTESPSGDQSDVNEDSYSFFAMLENGGMASFEGSRYPAGHALTGRLEIDGTEGTLFFSMERMNELVVTEPGRGPRTLSVVTRDDPWGDFFLPVGIQGAHPHGWRDVFAFQAHHMLSAIEHGTAIGPDAATFEDGYRVAEVVDAVLRSARSGSEEKIVLRTGEAVIDH